MTLFQDDLSELGVVHIPSKLTVSESNNFIDIITDQIKNQAYIENKARTANY